MAHERYVEGRGEALLTLAAMLVAFLILKSSRRARSALFGFVPHKEKRMNAIQNFIAKEPVAFWVGIVGGGIDLAVKYGVQIDPDLKHYILAGVPIALALIMARGAVTPTAKA